MVIELPLDIWIDIIKGPLTYPVLQRDTIRSLALTSANLRAVAVPVLYQSLEFTINRRHASQNAVLVNILQLYRRAAALHRAPHLLRHVRKLCLRSWKAYQGIFRGVGRTWGPIMSLGDDHMQSAIYECVIQLILRMPALQHVKIHNCPMTNHLHRSLCTHSRLDSLDILRASLDLWTAPTEPYRHRNIRFVRYEGAGYYTSDEYFRHILKQCSSDLRTLETRCTRLPSMVSWASSHPLSLHTLHITMILPKLLPAMRHLLLLCPELRVLVVPSKLNPVYCKALRITADMVPALHTIRGPAEFVTTLTIGRPVQRLNVVEMVDPTKLAVTDIVGHSTAHLQELVLDLIINSYQELLTFLPSLQIYQNLTHLEIFLYYCDRARCATITPRELNNALADALHPLVSLQVFDIHGVLLNSGGKDTALFLCPFGIESDPDDRGHPSLEMFRAECLGGGWWVWVPEERWSRRLSSYPSPRIGYNSVY